MPGPPHIDVALATHIQEALIELEDEGKPFFGDKLMPYPGAKPGLYRLQVKVDGQSFDQIIEVLEDPLRWVPYE